jgi:hypothetical protein
MVDAIDPSNFTNIYKWKKKILIVVANYDLQFKIN